MQSNGEREQDHVKKTPGLILMNTEDDDTRPPIVPVVLDDD